MLWQLLFKLENGYTLSSKLTVTLLPTSMPSTLRILAGRATKRGPSLIGIIELCQMVLLILNSAFNKAGHRFASNGRRSWLSPLSSST